MDDINEVSSDLFIDRERITDRVLKDLLKQKNVRAEFEKLYHEEWRNK